jgi:flagellar hook-length control protein FliK
MIAPSPLIATPMPALGSALRPGTLSGEGFPDLTFTPQSPLAAGLSTDLATATALTGPDLPALLDDSSRFALAITHTSPTTTPAATIALSETVPVAPTRELPTPVAPPPTANTTRPATMPKTKTSDGEEDNWVTPPVPAESVVTPITSIATPTAPALSPETISGDAEGQDAPAPLTTDSASAPALPRFPGIDERPAPMHQNARADLAPLKRDAPTRTPHAIDAKAISIQRLPRDIPIEVIAGDTAQPATAPNTSSIGFVLAAQPTVQTLSLDAVAQVIAVDPAQAVIDRQLDLSAANDWLDGLARDISAAATMREKLSFTLAPAHLGRMDVELSTSEAGVTVGFRSDNADARAIIAQAQPRLVEELRNNGLRLAESQIFSGAGQEREGSRSSHHEADHALLIESAAWVPSETEDETAQAPDGRFA